MTVVERGQGDPIVVIPGIQGRWPYVEATVEALAATHRVLTFSLAGERDGRPFDPAAGLENYTADLEAVWGLAAPGPATLVGVSFGGLVALRYAAQHPERVRALVLVSVPGPGWRPTGRHRWYVRVPRLAGLLFLIESPFRVGAEIRAALPSLRQRVRFAVRQLRVFARAPLSFSAMAKRARLAEKADSAGDARRIEAPTLVVTGEQRLDRVVPIGGTLAYARLIRGARAVAMTNTGHLGSLTQADRFAAIVTAFLNGTHDAAA